MTGPNEDRAAIHAYVSKRCHYLWHGFAAANGVSVSALIEEIGQEMDKMGEDFDINLAINFDTVVRRARKTDALRRRRGSVS